MEPLPENMGHYVGMAVCNVPDLIRTQPDIRAGNKPVSAGYFPHRKIRRLFDFAGTHLVNELLRRCGLVAIHRGVVKHPPQNFIMRRITCYAKSSAAYPSRMPLS